MKKPARTLVAIPGLLAVLGLAAEISVACATGSGPSAGDSAGDSGSRGGVDSSSGASTADASPDSGPGGGSSSGGSGSGSSSGGSGSGSSSGGSGSSSGSGSDGGGDADTGEDSGPSSEAGPLVTFGSTCPTGTVCAESFASDPVANGTFLPLVGSYTYNAASSTLSLGASSANTQLWIGARPSWTNYTVTLPIRIDTSGGNGGITFRMESTPASPSNNAGQMYYAGIAPNQVLLGIENDNWTEFSGPSATFAVGTFYTLQVVASGSSLSVSVGGATYVASYADATFTFGSLGLRTFASGMTYGAIAVTCN